MNTSRYIILPEKDAKDLVIILNNCYKINGNKRAKELLDILNL